MKHFSLAFSLLSYLPTLPLPCVIHLAMLATAATAVEQIPIVAERFVLLRWDSFSFMNFNPKRLHKRDGIFFSPL